MDNLQSKYIGISGEGYFDTDRNDFIYDLLVVGEYSLGYPGVPLSAASIFKFIKKVTKSYLSKGIKPIYHIYFGNLDFTQFIRSLDEYTIYDLGDRDSRNVIHDWSKKKIVSYSPGHQSLKPRSNHFKKVTVEQYFAGKKTAFKIDMQKENFFEIAWLSDESLKENDPKKAVWENAKIFDCGPLFQASFEDTVSDFIELTPHQSKILSKGKTTARNRMTKGEREKGYQSSCDYNMQESMSLAEVLWAFYLEISEIVPNIRPEFDGPGRIAAQWLKMKNVVTKELVEGVGTIEINSMIKSYNLGELISPEGYKFINEGYSAGWFETYAHGIIEGPIYEDDLNSAHPNAVSKLPNLNNCKYRWWYPKSDQEASWKELEEEHDKGNLIFCEFGFIGSNNKVGPFNVRHKLNSVDSIHRPLTAVDAKAEFKEIKTAKKTGLVNEVNLHRAFIVELDHSLPKPFEAVVDLYLERLRVGKNTPKGKAIKIILNSIYGKLSQSIGHPVYANPIYASLVTAETRIAIMEAIGSHPNGIEDLIRVETDAVLFSTPHGGLPLSNKLGEWEEKVYERGIWSLRPGIWGSLDEEIVGSELQIKSSSMKTRGFSKNEFAKLFTNEFYPALKAMGEKQEWDHDYKLEIPSEMRMISINDAIQRDPLLAGTFTTDKSDNEDIITEVTTNFRNDLKRTNFRWNPDKKWFDSDINDEYLFPSSSKDTVVGSIELPRGTEGRDPNWKEKAVLALVRGEDFYISNLDLEELKVEAKRKFLSRNRDNLYKFNSESREAAIADWEKYWYNEFEEKDEDEELDLLTWDIDL